MGGRRRFYLGCIVLAVVTTVGDILVNKGDADLAFDIVWIVAAVAAFVYEGRYERRWFRMEERGDQ